MRTVEEGIGSSRPPLRAVWVSLKPVAITVTRLPAGERDLHERVRGTFSALAEAAPDRYLVLDARQTPEGLAGAIQVRVSALLEARQLPAAAAGPTEGR